MKPFLLKSSAINPVIPTGRTRRRWLFWRQYEYEGPVYRARWQTPYNIEKWPRARYWLYAKPSAQESERNTK